MDSGDARGHRRGTAGPVAAAAALLLALTACSGSSDQSGSGASAVPAPTGSGAGPGSQPPGAATDLTGVGGSPVGLAFAAGSVWAASPDSNQVTRLDPATGDIVGTVAVGDTPLRLAAVPAGVWVSEFGAGTVSLIDPATGKAGHTTQVGTQPEGLATDGRHLWVVLQEEARLVELDAATGGRVRAVALPGGGAPRLAAFAPAAAGRRATVWVSDFGADRVVPVDAATGTVGAPVAACPGPQAVAVAGGTLWVACLSGRLVAVDLGTHRVGGNADLTALAGSPDAVTVADGKVWVGLATGPAVVAVDPATLRVSGYSKVADAGPVTKADIDVLVAGGQFWVSSYNEQGVHHDPVGSLGPPP